MDPLLPAAPAGEGNGQPHRGAAASAAYRGVRTVLREVRRAHEHFGSERSHRAGRIGVGRQPTIVGISTTKYKGAKAFRFRVIFVGMGLKRFRGSCRRIPSAASLTSTLR